ncbi:hypothetical protein MMC29_001767 [Sticta canariensis]|nr:hypothetical protein [Sticta canariensis]
MLGKRKPPTPLLPPKKQRKSAPTIEEISFDTSAREDYLTGFHKRKLQRIKHAKEEAAKKKRAEKIAARKILRDGRKADLEKHIEEINNLLRNAAEEVGGTDEEDQEDRETWDGIAEASMVDNEVEFVDEDRFTTVTVEAVQVSRDGLHKITQENKRDSTEPETHTLTRAPATTDKHGKRIWTKERPGGPKKKKKFRYESKAERKVTRYKERSGNKSKAKVRKE